MSAPPIAAIPLFGPAFATDPHAAYQQCRHLGPIAPVQLAPGVYAWLVTDAQLALWILRDTTAWAKDPRPWQATMPEDCPVLPMIGYRPNVLFSDGAEHERFRRVVIDALALVDPGRVRDQVHHIADALLADFAAEGQADLVARYTNPLPAMVFNQLFGLREQHGPELVRALAGMLEASSPEESTAAGAAFLAYVSDLVASKLHQRGDDLTSWYLDHPQQLTPEEATHQVILTLGAALEPTANLISNAISVLLADRATYAALSNGSLAARTAIDHVLRREPPMANYGTHYALKELTLGNFLVRPAQPVLVSYAAINAAAAAENPDTGHLAWSAGPHACPARDIATLIAMTAVERLINAFGDLTLAVPREQLVWRPGPFQRALAHLPVAFTPVHL